MADAVRSAVTTVEASPTPRKIRAGVIRAPPPIPVRPTIVPTQNAAAMIEKKSAVNQSPMGAAFHRRLGKTRKSTERPQFVEMTRPNSPIGGMRCRSRDLRLVLGDGRRRTTERLVAVLELGHG